MRIENLQCPYLWAYTCQGGIRLTIDAASERNALSSCCASHLPKDLLQRQAMSYHQNCTPVPTTSSDWIAAVEYRCRSPVKRLSSLSNMPCRHSTTPADVTRFCKSQGSRPVLTKLNDNMTACFTRAPSQTLPPGPCQHGRLNSCHCCLYLLTLPPCDLLLQTPC